LSNTEIHGAIQQAGFQLSMPVVNIFFWKFNFTGHGLDFVRGVAWRGVACHALCSRTSRQ